MGMSIEMASFDAVGGQGEVASARPVDLVHLARYTMGNRLLEREVLELFLTQSEQYLARLSQAGDAKAWKDAAHTIKGSARGIGAWQVACCAEEAESLDAAALEKGRQDAIDALEVNIRETNGYIRSLLSDA